MRYLTLAGVLAAALVVIAPVTGSGQGAGAPSPEACTRCYKKLQQDNQACQKLEGQDWQICREAAATAYRRCSQGC